MSGKLRKKLGLPGKQARTILGIDKLTRDRKPEDVIAYDGKQFTRNGVPKAPESLRLNK